jgi:hypothetical protein
MSEMVSDSERPERRDVLVFINHDDRPDLKQNVQTTTLERNRAMNEWFEAKSSPARDVISKLGGVILEQNWFWSGLRASLPQIDIEAGISTIESTPHVNSVHFPFD